MARENYYELVVILNNINDENDMRREVENVKALVEKNCVEFVGKADWGLKTFQYPIQKKTNGYYVYFMFKSDSQSPALISESLKMNENVIRFMTIQVKSTVKDNFEKVSLLKMDLTRYRRENRSTLKRLRETEFRSDDDDNLDSDERFDPNEDGDNDYQDGDDYEKE